MTVALNHTIVHARDAEASAAFLSDILGLASPERLYHFVMVETGNGVSLDFMSVPDGDDIAGQHYAFLVSEDEFDEIFGRIPAEGPRPLGRSRASPGG